MLIDELWEIARNDVRLSQMKGRDYRSFERRGAAKRILMRAIDESSLGVFGERMYFFTGKLYEPIDKLSFRKVLYDVMDEKMKMTDGDLVRLQDVYYDCENAVFSKKLNVSNTVMVFNNGVLDVENNEFHTVFDKRFVQIHCVPYDYNPDMKTFLWDQFINQVLPDRRLQDVLQMFLGATFVDRKKVKIEKIVILLGVTGANGKSVVQGVVKGVLGEEYVSEQSLGKLCSVGRDGELAASAIEGKRLNYCTEMDRTDFHRHTARIKALVSGERVVASRKFVDPYYVKEIPLLMANANQMPAFNAKDRALLRRLYVIPFDVTIPENRQNRSLGRELEAEYPAILNWILEGRKKFIANGYNLPPDETTSKVIVTEKVNRNNVLYFMDKKLKYKPRLDGVTMSVQKWVQQKDLYSAYLKWCMANDQQPFGRVMFGTFLEEGGFVKVRRNNGNYIGVYGGAGMETSRRIAEEGLARLRKRNPDEYRLWIDGKMYIIGAENLASYTGVGKGTIYKLTNNGAFDGHIYAMRHRRAYEADGCLKVLRERKYITTDKEEDVYKAFNWELKEERRTYNEWNENNGLPYRKYKESPKQIGEGIIVVPDWTTRDETIEMAREAGYDVTNIVRYSKCRKENRNDKI